MGRYGEKERKGRAETETETETSIADLVFFFSFFLAPYSLLLPITLPD
jgi:hypothetical protein